MNIVLLNAEEAAAGYLPAGDRRAKHILEVLGAVPGGKFYVGIIGEKRGLATVQAVDNERISWSVKWENAVQSPLPWDLLAGLPRPQTARKILQEAASLGARSIHFFVTEKGDPAYAQSSLWRDGEADALLLKGTEQAFSTLVPELTVHASLKDAIVTVEQSKFADDDRQVAKVFLDIYEAAIPLGEAVNGAASSIVAVGPERGWSDMERILLRASGYVGAHMGDRVLRVETACVAAGAVVLSALGVWKPHRMI